MSYCNCKLEVALTATSSDDEITRAIDKIGDQRFSWRGYDWPEPEEGAHAKAWVKAGDIGRSTSDDPSLLNRLKQLVVDGVLEMRYISRLPRFRVRR